MAARTTEFLNVVVEAGSRTLLRTSDGPRRRHSISTRSLQPLGGRCDTINGGRQTRIKHFRKQQWTNQAGQRVVLRFSTTCLRKAAARKTAKRPNVRRVSGLRGSCRGQECRRFFGQLFRSCTRRVGTSLFCHQGSHRTSGCRHYAAGRPNRR